MSELKRKGVVVFQQKSYNRNPGVHVNDKYTLPVMHTFVAPDAIAANIEARPIGPEIFASTVNTVQKCINLVLGVRTVG